MHIDGKSIVVSTVHTQALYAVVLTAIYTTWSSRCIVQVVISIVCCSRKFSWQGLVLAAFHMSFILCMLQFFFNKKREIIKSALFLKYATFALFRSYQHLSSEK